MFLAEGLNKFFCILSHHCFLQEHTIGLASYREIWWFHEGHGKTVIDKSSLQYFLNGSIDVHRASISYGSHWNIISFDIRHDDKILDDRLILNLRCSFAFQQ